MKKLILGILLICLFSQRGTAQTMVTRTYDFQNPQKGYAVEQLDGVDEYLVVGTYFDGLGTSSMRGRIQVLHTDYDGTILSSEILYPQSGYDTDDRVTDLLKIDATTYAIISSSTNNPGSTSPQNNIRVTLVDNQGALMQSDVLRSTDLDATSLYPLKAIYDQYSGSTPVIHIAGYTTPSTVTANPTWNDPKKAFILSYDPITFSITASQTFDWQWTSTATNQPKDFDMLHRLSLHQHNGDYYLLATGSSNTEHIPTGSTTINKVMGTSLLLLDPQNLNLYNNIGVVDEWQVFNDTYGEYGADISEVYNNGNDDYFFVLGNRNFRPGINNNPDFDLGPQDMMISSFRIDYAQQKIFHSNTGSRLTFNNNFTNGSAWGHQFVQPPGTASFFISGFQTDLPTGTSCLPVMPTNTPSQSNINPFVNNLNYSYSNLFGFSSPTVGFWSTFLTTNGTGSSSTPVSSYYGMPDALSSLGFMPDNCLFNGTYVLSAPYWEITNSSNLLQLKFLRADNNGQINPCQSYAQCASYSYNITTYHKNGQGMMNSTGTALNINPIATVYSNLRSMQNASTVPTETVCGTVYKQASREKAPLSTTASISPNPANDHITVTLGTVDAAEKVSVAMYDMTGRLIANLYNGEAGKMLTNLPLPSVANGLYFVRVAASGKMILQEKLAIQ